MNRLLWYIFVAVVVLLLVSVAFNAVLFSRARQYYFDLNAVRLNPLDLNAYPTTPLTPTTMSRLVFFGDSRAARWLIADDLAEYEIVNRGVEAETSAQAALRFSAHVTPLHPKVLVVQVGINDLKTIALFPERTAEIIATTKENIWRIVEQGTGLNAQIILTTVFPVGEFPLERRMFWSPDIELAIQDVNNYLRSLAAESVIILDAASILIQDGRANPNYYVDELHLNEAGYEALNQELKDVLRKTN